MSCDWDKLCLGMNCDGDGWSLGISCDGDGWSLGMNCGWLGPKGVRSSCAGMSGESAVQLFEN